MLSHGNAAYVAMASMAEGAYGTDEIYLHTSPSFHIAGAMNVFQAFICASRNVVLPRFEAGAALAAISAQGVTQSLLVPTMIGMILDHPNFNDTDTSSIRRILYGAAPMTDALLDRAMAAFPRAEFMQLYGMTETASNACILHSRVFTAPDGKRLRSRSVGRAMVGSEVGIFGVAGDLLPQHFQKRHAVAGYAKLLGCSEKSLGRAVQTIAGITAKEFLSQRIALEAKRLLVHTSLPVSVIGDRLGFDEPTNFVKFFRREVQKSPGQFRGEYTSRFANER